MFDQEGILKTLVCHYATSPLLEFGPISAISTSFSISDSLDQHLTAPTPLQVVLYIHLPLSYFFCMSWMVDVLSLIACFFFYGYHSLVSRWHAPLVSRPPLSYCLWYSTTMYVTGVDVLIFIHNYRFIKNIFTNPAMRTFLPTPFIIIAHSYIQSPMYSFFHSFNTIEWHLLMPS